MTKTLQNQGDFEILTPREWITQMPLIIERAGRTAYQSYKCKACSGRGEVGNQRILQPCPKCLGTGEQLITEETAAKFIRMLIKRGHESVLEHSILTVRFMDCSRGFCYDDQTEVLTRKGWKLFRKLSPFDVFLTYNLETRRIEYQRSIGITIEDWDGELIYAKSSMVDLAVTPNHRMVYFPYDKRKNRCWQIAQAKDIEGKRVKFLRGLLPGTVWDRETPTELHEMLRLLEVNDTDANLLHAAWLLGLWMTDGSIEMPREGDGERRGCGGRLNIAQTKAHVREELIYRTSQMLMKVKTQSNGAGFRIHGNDLVRLFAKKFVFGKPRKEHQRIPTFMKPWPVPVLQSFLDGVIAGDGSVYKENGHVVVYSANQEFCGDLQELFMRVGLCASVREDDRCGESHEVNGNEVVHRKVCYIVSVTRRDNEHLFNRDLWHRGRYHGKVYCVTVPNGTLYVRRNGKACWSGNTHELVRHRLCAFTQESTRYVDEKETPVVCPPGQDSEALVGGLDGPGIEFETMAAQALSNYRSLRQAGWPPQDARQILPIGITSEIVMTCNLRQARHIFSLRTAKPAHWEIRRVLGLLLSELKVLLPAVFDDFEYVADCKDGIPYYEQQKLGGGTE